MEKIILPTASHYHVIPIKEILFCKSNNTVTTFYLTDGQQIAVSASIKEYEKILGKFDFFRSHQSYLVNTEFIRTIDKTNAFNLILSNGSEIPVSTRKRRELMLKLNENNSNQKVINKEV